MKPEQEEADGGLLSRKEVIARIEKQIRLWNNDTVTMACADMLADLKQMPVSDAATSMRSACVEKVREYLSDCRDEERGIIEAIAHELESASIREQEAKDGPNP